MLVEHVVRKPFSAGPFKLDKGDPLTDEAEAYLPPGRVKVLKDQGWITERPIVQPAGIDRELLDRIAELEARPVVSDPMVELIELFEALARIDALEEKVARLEARRGPGRPRKEEA